MKGVILSINPDARIVDISHGISAQDVMEGAYVLRSAAPYFPAETIHVAVIDPGVGTARHPVALQSGDHLFVGPDNGIFPLTLDGRSPEECVVLDRQEFWRTDEISSTFHGRDIFAPVAAHLSKNVRLHELGRPMQNLKPLQWALPKADDEGVQGWIVHVDRFGNCITNVTRKLLDERGPGRAVKCFVGNAILNRISSTYADVDPGEPLLHFNSGDFLEIAVRAGNAAELHGIRKGDPVNLLFRDGA